MRGRNPGRFRERLTLQQKTRTSDGQGGSTLAWTGVSPAVTVWADVKRMSTRDRLLAAQADSTADYEVTVRARTDFTGAGEYAWLWGSQRLVVAGPPQSDRYGEYLTFPAAAERV